MNTDLADYLHRLGVEFEVVSKARKVKLLSRWGVEFSPLRMRALRGKSVPEVDVDNAADEQMRCQKTHSFFILPDDDSGMPSVRCCHETVPDFSALLSDTFTKCEEIVICDVNFDWSCVLVNHGAAGVGRYYMRSGARAG
ncbi:MAG: hypothetical protein R3D67_02495 [Hyphomicrobiaceae bacterium]